VSLLQRDPGNRVQILDEEGHVLQGASVPEIDDDTLVGIYRKMRLARHFDERAVSLQRQGRMGTYPPLSGQEAAQVASGYALDEDDWVFPSYREHGVGLVRGLSIKQTLLYWMGDERGNALDPDLHFFTVAVPIGTQIPHATGAAWASKLKGEDRAFIVYFGDGATSEGDFHEGLNFAGVFDVPAVYFCNNNQWAISVPREHQTASETLAQKADAYGFDGIQVDGMDPLAVYGVTREAIKKAKNPGPNDRRPTLIEAVQYRFGAHTTADDPSIYRSEDEVEEWKRRDPIPRLETFLRERGLLDDERIDAIADEVREHVADAIEAAESEIRPAPESMFEHVTGTPDWRREEQEAYLRRLREQYGDDTLLED